MLEFKKMTLQERKTCALLSAAAFYDYEYFSIYVPDDKRRKKFLDAMIICEFKANWGNPEVIFITASENERVVAVAQLCTPKFKKPSDAEYIKAGWFGIMLKGGIREVQAWQNMEKQASAPCHELTGINWYLSLLTVSKNDEGKGIGSRFLSECLVPYVKDAGGDTLSLFTNSEKNCRFYESNGFTLFDEKRFEYAGKTIGNWSYILEV